MIYLTLNMEGIRLHLVDDSPDGNDLSLENISANKECAELLRNSDDVYQLHVFCVDNLIDDIFGGFNYFLSKESILKIKNNCFEDIDVICPVYGATSAAFDHAWRSLFCLIKVAKSIYMYDIKLCSTFIDFSGSCENDGELHFIPCAQPSALRYGNRIPDWKPSCDKAPSILPVLLKDLTVYIGYISEINHDEIYDDTSYIQVNDWYNLFGHTSDFQAIRNGQLKDIKLAIDLDEGTMLGDHYPDLHDLMEATSHRLFSPDSEIKKYVPPEQDIEDDDLPF